MWASAFELSLQQQQNPPPKFGEAAQAGAGGDGGDGGALLKDASRVQSGAGEGEIVRWAAFLSAEVMAEW